MGMDRFLEISRVDREEVDCLVAAAAGQNRASRIVRYACRKLGEAAYNAYERSIFAIPDADCPVIRTGGKVFGVRRPGDVIDSLLVSLE